MANMIVTLRIMPESPEVNLDELVNKVREIITNFKARLLEQIEQVPVAFGLKSLNLKFVIDENRGSEEISEAIEKLDEVSSSEVIGMSRAMG